MSYIFEVELIVLAYRLDVEDEGKMRSWRTLGFWLNQLCGWIDIYGVSSVNSQGRKWFGELGGEDDEFSFGHFEFELEYLDGEVL